MRWIFAVLGALCLAVGTATFLSSTKVSQGDATQDAIRQALRSQTNAAALEAKESLEHQEKSLGPVLEQLSTKKTGNRVALESTGPSLVLIKAGNELREAAHRTDAAPEGLRVVLQATLGSALSPTTRISLWEDNVKRPYVLVRGKVGVHDYAAAYPMDRVFGRLRSATALHPWVASHDGKLLFHSSPRLVGMGAMNIRPVATGLESIRKGAATDGVGTYVGFDGKEAFGAWTVVPAWGLTIGSEWPQATAQHGKVSWLTWVALLSLVSGALIVGFCLTPRPVQVFAAQREIKDLSHEARGFIKKAEKQAEKALEFARQRDREASDLEADARDRVAQAERIRWIFEKTEAFLEDAIEAKSETDVWDLLAQYLSNMALNVPVLVFSYSNSSCTLVPQAQAGIDVYPESAQRYLRESRMLVGDHQALVQIESNSAFKGWKDRWARFMPIQDIELYNLPFASPTGSRGVISFLFSPGMMSETELQHQRELWELFAYRAGWLYDLKKRLLQSRTANARKSPLASSPDNLRNRPAQT